ncbi:18415_t:CDS:2, partial [Rhizophagus irregularis]
EYFIAIFGVFLRYTIQSPSKANVHLSARIDIEIMNGELKDRIDTVKGMINLIDNEFDAIQTIVGGANNAWVVNVNSSFLFSNVIDSSAIAGCSSSTSSTGSPDASTLDLV